MADAFIVRRGGGGASSDLFAAIGVTYSEGSTCTCTNGADTLAAKNTSGQWVFAIPEIGTWTVTTGDKSKSVSITKEGQCEVVNLAELVLFESGVEQNTDISGGFKANSANNVTVGDTIKLSSSRTYFGEGSSVWGSSGNYYSQKKVIAGEYEYFCVNVVSNINNSGRATNRVWLYAAKTTDTFSDNNVLAKIEIPVSPTQTGVFKLPFASLGSAILGVMVYGDFGEHIAEIDRIWLE